MRPKAETGTAIAFSTGFSLGRAFPVMSYCEIEICIIPCGFDSGL